jgi:hypothetical protein
LAPCLTRWLYQDALKGGSSGGVSCNQIQPQFSGYTGLEELNDFVLGSFNSFLASLVSSSRAFQPNADSVSLSGAYDGLVFVEIDPGRPFVAIGEMAYVVCGAYIESR